MRNLLVRNLAVVAMIVLLSSSASAAEREKVDRDRGRAGAIVSVVKRIVRALGDGLIIPIP